MHLFDYGRIWQNGTAELLKSGHGVPGTLHVLECLVWEEFVLVSVWAIWSVVIQCCLKSSSGLHNAMGENIIDQVDKVQLLVAFQPETAPHLPGQWCQTYSAILELLFLINGQIRATFVKWVSWLEVRMWLWRNDSICDKMTPFVTKWLPSVPKCDTIIQISPFIKLFRVSEFVVRFCRESFWKRIMK